MALRYQSGATNIAVAGSTIVHDLTGGTPTEYSAAVVSAGTGMPYFLGVSATNLVVAANGVALSANVMAAINHSIIQ